MDKSKQRTLKKRAKILDNSIKLFLDNDIKKVTMDDIAKQSNVSKMTVYKYFGDKELLYQYVGESVFERYYNDLEREFDSREHLTQKMIRCTSVLIDFITTGHLSLCIKLGRLNEEVKRKHDLFNSRTKKIIVTLVQEGKKEKFLRADISDDSIYHYIDMGLYYFQYNKDYREKITTEPSFRKEFMTFIWSNIFIDYSHFKV